MIRFYTRLAAIFALLCPLSACQYFSFLRTNTVDYPHNLQWSPEGNCTSMGAMRGDSSFDWCVADEQKRQAQYFQDHYY
jgi:hypothetical protein